MSPSWQRARQEILYLALASMDVCFLVPIVLAISPFAGGFAPERAAFASLIVILIAFNLVRLLDSLDLKETVQRDIGLAVLVFWILTTLRFTLYQHVPLLSLAWIGEMASHLGDRTLWPQDVTIIVTTLVFWWRGMELAGRPLEVDSIGLYFRSGVLIMAVAVALVSQMREWSPTPFVFAFFFLSLVAIALTRAEEITRWREGAVFPFSPGWLIAIAGAAGGVILIAVGLIALFSGENVLSSLALLGPIWDVLRTGIMILVYAFFYLLFPIIQFIVQRLFAAIGGETDYTPELTLGETPFGTEDLVTRAAPLEPYRGILTALGIAAAILIVALAYGRLWRARRRLGQVDTVSVWGEKESQLGLGDRARRGLRNLANRLGFLGRWYTAASIRRIYAQMAATAARRGYPRPSSDTPFEYLSTLDEVWPDMRPQLEAITNAYVMIHYGELPETESELQAIRSAWDQLNAHSNLHQA